MSQTVLAPGAAQRVAVRENTPDLRVVFGAAALFVGGAAWLARAADWRQAALYLVGGALGVALYHAMFGFTTAWRVFLADRRGAGLRAQMLLLGATCLLVVPALARGSLFGRAVAGSIAPAGVAVVAGAFIFGIGMQLGGGCASGTLYTAGGGNPGRTSIRRRRVPMGQLADDPEHARRLLVLAFHHTYRVSDRTKRTDARVRRLPGNRSPRSRPRSSGGWSS